MDGSPVQSSHFKELEECSPFFRFLLDLWQNRKLPLSSNSSSALNLHSIDLQVIFLLSFHHASLSPLWILPILSAFSTNSFLPIWCLDVFLNIHHSTLFCLFNIEFFNHFNPYLSLHFPLINSHHITCSSFPGCAFIQIFFVDGYYLCTITI